MVKTSIAQKSDFFQQVKRIPFTDVQKVFHGAEPKQNKVRCPFHQEEKASFHLYPDGFKCFGCGEYGSNVDFVMKLYGLENPLAAAKVIAERFGIPFNDSLLTTEEKLKYAKVKAEREKEKVIQVEFEKWVKEAQQKTRGLAEAIRSIMDEKGVNLDLKIVELIHLLPVFEHWADILESGTDEEKQELYQDTELRRWTG